jgi:hypothetical protein
MGLTIMVGISLGVAALIVGLFLALASREP